MTVAAKGFDTEALSDGTYSNFVVCSIGLPGDITTKYDEGANDCDADLEFSVSWSSDFASHSLGVEANKLWKKGDGFLGLFPPHNMEYGFTVSSSRPRHRNG